MTDTLSYIPVLAPGDSFSRKTFRGLTTLKIHQADQLKENEMDEESQRFRQITIDGPDHAVPEFRKCDRML
ncbi:MAG: hypothetical protein ACLUI0_11795 [Blautia massiliensis (ex Durand et al. 2017)]